MTYVTVITNVKNSECYFYDICLSYDIIDYVTVTVLTYTKVIAYATVVTYVTVIIPIAVVCCYYDECKLIMLWILHMYVAVMILYIVKTCFTVMKHVTVMIQVFHDP